MSLEIVPYDDAWPLAAAAERDRIAAALGPISLRIEHHGSTSVPGLAAKPVIDIQVSVANLQPLDRYAQPLAALGYIHVVHADDAVCPFFHRPRSWPHSHHLHVVRAGDIEEARTLAFRDYLREIPRWRASTRTSSVVWRLGTSAWISQDNRHMRKRKGPSSPR